VSRRLSQWETLHAHPGRGASETGLEMAGGLAPGPRTKVSTDDKSADPDLIYNNPYFTTARGRGGTSVDGMK